MQLYSNPQLEDLTDALEVLFLTLKGGITHCSKTHGQRGTKTTTGSKMLCLWNEIVETSYPVSIEST